MAEVQKQTPVTFQELLVSTLAQSDALAKLLIEKGTREEFMARIAEEWAAGCVRNNLSF